MTMTLSPTRLVVALVLAASAAVMLTTPALWHEDAPLRDRILLAIWLIGAIASFIYVIGHRPQRIPLRWLVRADVGPPLAAMAALLVLAGRLGWT